MGSIVLISSIQVFALQFVLCLQTKCSNLDKEPHCWVFPCLPETSYSVCFNLYKLLLELGAFAFVLLSLPGFGEQLVLGTNVWMCGRGKERERDLPQENIGHQAAEARKRKL